MTWGAAKIIALVPVKNEAWILDAFLAVTSQFADGILIADQQSTDGGREIARRYPKTVWIENTGAEYDEAHRQFLLIKEARRRWEPPLILVAPDADEILAADSLDCQDWAEMKICRPGTVLLFEKPDLLPGLNSCLRYPENPVPMAFVDDGSPHEAAKIIHSPRVPLPPGAPRRMFSGVKFLHYGLTRPRSQQAKLAFYTLRESLAGTSSLMRRRWWYGNFQSDLAERIRTRARPVEEAWFAGWEDRGIKVRDLPAEAKRPWQIDECLRLMARIPLKRLWVEPLWNIDWELARQQALAEGIVGIPTERIIPPPRVLKASLRLIDRLFRFFVAIRERCGGIQS